MITKSGYNIRVWQDRINGVPTLSVDLGEDGRMDVLLTDVERSELRDMLDVYVIEAEGGSK